MNNLKHAEKAVYVKDLVDDLGRKLAKLADVQKQVDALKASLLKEVKSGHSFNGLNYRIVHVEQHAKVTDWKKIANRFEPSRQLVRANTKFVEKHAIKCTARKEG